MCMEMSLGDVGGHVGPVDELARVKRGFLERNETYASDFTI